MTSRLLSVAVLALAVRLVHLFQLSSAPFATLRLGDAEAYHRWATAIVQGDWMGREVFFQAPLYPYLLAAVYGGLGDGVTVLRLVHTVAGVASCVLLAAAGVEFFGGIGLAAGVLLAIYPPAVFLDALLDKTALTTLLVCSLLYLLSLKHVRGRPFGVGVVLGLLALTRENAAVLVVPALVWLAADPRARTAPSAPSRPSPRARRLGAAIGGLALVLAPVAIRNEYVGGTFSPTTSQFGPNLYIGNHAGARGLYEPLVAGHGSAATEREDAVRLAQADVGRPLSAGEVSSYWTRRVLAFIRADPGAWLGLMLRKLALTINAGEIGDTESIEVHAEVSSMLRLLAPFTFAVVFGLSAFGVVIGGGSWRRTWVVPACAVTYASSVVMFFVFARYRFPLVPPLLLVGAGGLAVWPASSRRRRAWAVTAGLAAAAASLVPLESTATNRVTHYVNIANALAAEPARGDAASFYYSKALATAPGLPAALVGLGTLAMREQRYTTAAEHLRAAVRGWPDNADARLNAAMALAHTGENAGARAELRAALALGTTDPAIGLITGRIALNEARPADALREFQHVWQRLPSNADALVGAAEALEALGRRDESATLFRMADTVAPGRPDVRAALTRLSGAATVSRP